MGVQGGSVGITELQGGLIGIGSIIPGATQGSVLFVGLSGTLAQDNANFYWDDTAYKLKIGNELDFWHLRYQVSFHAQNLIAVRGDPRTPF